MIRISEEYHIESLGVKDCLYLVHTNCIFKSTPYSMGPPCIITGIKVEKGIQGPAIQWGGSRLCHIVLQEILDKFSFIVESFA